MNSLSGKTPFGNAPTPIVAPIQALTKNGAFARLGKLENLPDFDRRNF
jgi:hypothetical protein